MAIQGTKRTYWIFWAIRRRILADSGKWTPGFVFLFKMDGEPLDSFLYCWQIWSSSWRFFLILGKNRSLDEKTLKHLIGFLATITQRSYAKEAIQNFDFYASLEAAVLVRICSISSNSPVRNRWCWVGSRSFELKKFCYTFTDPNNQWRELGSTHKFTTRSDAHFPECEQ